MKLLAILALLVAVGCRAQDTNAVTSKVVQPDSDNDGKPDFHVETTYRGAQKIMIVWSDPNAQGVMKVTSRSYFAGGDMVTTESDEDRDGVFETLAVYRPDTGDMEVFTRQRNGSVTPVSAQILAAYNKQNAAISQFVDKAFDNGTDMDKTMEMAREFRRKIQEAKKEKTNERD